MASEFIVGVAAWQQEYKRTRFTHLRAGLFVLGDAAFILDFDCDNGEYYWIYYYYIPGAGDLGICIIIAISCTKSELTGTW